ncbi:MAG: dimethylsulfonioproprionate lyase family protein [Qingshengfaniella sp.]
MTDPQCGLANGLRDILLADRSDYAGRHIAELVLSRVRASALLVPTPMPPALDIQQILGAAFAANTRAGGALLQIARSLEVLGPHMIWRQRSNNGQTASEGFNTAHASALIANATDDTPLHCDGFVIGVSVAAPHTTFPLHDHPREELYLSLTPAAFTNAETGWRDIVTGGTFHNKSGISHTMRSGTMPLVAIWLMGRS